MDKITDYISGDTVKLYKSIPSKNFFNFIRLLLQEKVTIIQILNFLELSVFLHPGTQYQHLNE